MVLYPFGKRDTAKRNMRILYGLGLGSMLILALPNWAWNQAPTVGHDPTYDTPRIDANSNAAALPPQLSAAEMEQLQRAANAERHRSMVADTQKMVELAQALDDELSQSHADAFTAAQISQIGQIQKLARKVRSAMSSTAKSSNVIQPVPIMVPNPPVLRPQNP